MKPYLLRESFSKATRPPQFYSLDDLEQAPSLHARATAIKEQLNAHQSIRAREQHNKEEYLAFMELFDKDLIFRLKITQQYHLLRTLFEDPKLKVQWQAFLDDIEDADNNKKRVRDEWTEYAQAKTQTLQNQSLAQVNNPALHWTPPPTHASEMEQWAHYERELKRVTSNYHQERAAIHLQTANAHINHLDKVIDHLRVQKDENRELIQHLEEKRVVVQKRRQHLLNSVPNPEHPHSLTAMKKYEQECEVLKKDIQSVLHELHHHPKAQSKEIAEILAKNDELNQNEQEALRQLDGAYEEQRKILIAHIEIKKAAAIAKLVEKIDISLTKLVHAQESLIIPQEDRKALEQSVARLEQLKSALGENQDLTRVQAIENQLHNELHLVNRILSEKVIAPFHHSQEEIEQEYLPDEPEPLSHLEPKQLIEPSAQKIEPAPQDEPKAGVSQSSAPLNKEVEPPSSPLPPQAAPIISIQQKMRSHLQDLRLENPVERIIKDMEHAMDILKQSGEIAAQANDIVVEIQKIIIQIKELSEEETPQDLLEDLNDKLCELADIHPEFTKTQKKLNQIIEEIESELSPISNRK